jgi:GMP synthase (glutamine-hydrolysing) A subunit
MHTDIHQENVLILDFGSQYTQLIARRVREAGVYSEIRPYSMSAQAIREFRAKGIILSGGPESGTEALDVRAPDVVFELGVPVLGICYGLQTMAAQLGGAVESSAHREFGYAQVRARGHSRLLRDIEDHASPEGYGLLDVWMSHGDRVNSLPAGFRAICTSDNSPIAGMADEERGFYGLQFHPEVTTPARGNGSSTASSTRSAAAATSGGPRTSSRTASAGCASRSAATGSCWPYRAGSTPQWWRRSCTGRSATSSPASSSTTACCASTRATR